MNKIEALLEKRPDTRYFYQNDETTRIEGKFNYFADIVIDGKSLFQFFRSYDYISILGWGKEEYQKEKTSGLLLQIPSELENGRYELYVSLCADLGCGAITINIERSNNSVVWKDFGLDYGYKDGIKEIDRTILF